MGDRMTCVTTPKNMVTQGDANHPPNVASPLPPPTGAVGGGGAAQHTAEVVTQSIHHLSLRQRLGSPRLHRALSGILQQPTTSLIA
jgi:hypothetical protein